MHVAHRAGAPFTLFARYDRIGHPPRGRAGGESGAPGRVGLLSGTALKPKGAQAIPPGATLVLEMPGGGGHGEPAGRDPARVAEDVRNGLVSPDPARETYRVAIHPDGGVDDAEGVAFSLGWGHDWMRFHEEAETDYTEKKKNLIQYLTSQRDQTITDMQDAIRLAKNRRSNYGEPAANAPAL